jgi:transaldolase/glucose-6-phosphate isomerase
MKAQRQAAPANPFELLHGCGQSVWLDYLSRRFIADGSLKRLVEHDRLAGVTSNPTIFEKAIAGAADYDAQLEALESGSDCDVMALYERLAIEDIRSAAEVLRPVHDASGGEDGFVSLEVSPYLAMDTEATIAEARRLSREVARDNAMIKVPATQPGIPAIRALTAEGIKVNITLLFSQKVYEQVVEAYLSGLEELIARGGDPAKVRSVASFFVSRIDVAVDKQIGERAPALRGKVAIANAKLAYQRYKRLFSGARWEKLASRGAHVQRVLWASTGTKDPAYSDVLYVEALIGPQTVDTIPPATMDAFRDHGRVAPALERDIGKAEQVMAEIERLGISMDAVTAQVLQDGVQRFVEDFDKLMAAVARKRAALLGDRLNGQAMHVPAAMEKPLAAELESWRRGGKLRRLWAGDARVWTGADEARWLGWLDIVEAQRRRIGELQALGDALAREGFSHAVLLGMGGSSLGPEVLAETFGPQRGRPPLLVLDSTDPAQIRAVEETIDPARTLFIVSSKSGTTLEPNILAAYFRSRAKGGSRFVAVTDPGSALEQLARREGYRHIAHGVPSIGGRYSVLSDFGMVPAAAMGLDIDKLLAAAQRMVRSCSRHVPPAENPGVRLGMLMGLAAREGRDKLTILASPGLASFGAWLEQLVAESTGKQGRGIVPVDAEPLGAPQVYGNDRLFAVLCLAGESAPNTDELERAGHPVVRITVADRYHLGQEFFRWEIATAVAGAVIGIDPFDQPDVEASKVKARELTDAYERQGELPADKPLPLRVDDEALGERLAAHLDRLQPGDYFALLAYLERSPRNRERLQEMRRTVRDAKRVATCLGFGPRFLHSTGQAYKGGPNSGVFLQITCDEAADLPVPGHQYSFGVVKAAQARGDLAVLAERGRRALRVHLGAEVQAGLAKLAEAMRRACSSA